MRPLSQLPLPSLRTFVMRRVVQPFLPHAMFRLHSSRASLHSTMRMSSTMQPEGVGDNMRRQLLALAQAAAQGTMRPEEVSGITYWMLTSKDEAHAKVIATKDEALATKDEAHAKVIATKDEAYAKELITKDEAHAKVLASKDEVLASKDELLASKDLALSSQQEMLSQTLTEKFNTTASLAKLRAILDPRCILEFALLLKYGKQGTTTRRWQKFYDEVVLDQQTGKLSQAAAYLHDKFDCSEKVDIVQDNLRTLYGRLSNLVHEGASPKFLDLPMPGWVCGGDAASLGCANAIAVRLLQEDRDVQGELGRHSEFSLMRIIYVNEKYEPRFVLTPEAIEPFKGG